MSTHSTQVAIIGAGPAGLGLGRLLTLAGVDNIIIEKRSREYVEQRIRAGMLEHPTVELLIKMGVGERLQREGQFDSKFELRYDHQRIWVPMEELTGGRRTVLYPQQEVVKDLLAARDLTGDPITFEADDVALHDVDGEHPYVTYTDSSGVSQRVEAPLIAGCDGFHGVSRPTIPADRLTVHTKDYPFAWLGILADVPPSTRELIYAHHPNGFAMHSRRSSTVSRLYLQVPPEADAEDYDDQEIWDELQRRLGTDDDWTLQEGKITQKSVTAMRSVVVESLQYGRLYLAGDAAHIVPPTAAKGLNLAMSDVSVLAEGMVRHLVHGDDEALAGYSQTALRRIWRAQEFSRSMTALLHHVPGSEFEARLQEARLENLTASRANLASMCEQYVGLPFESRIDELIETPTVVAL